MLGRLAWLVVASLAMVLLGCQGVHLAGTNDVEIELAVGEDADRPPRDPRAAVQARLSAARIPADVDRVDATHLRVTVDADAAPTAEELLAWRGGLAVYELEPGASVGAPAGAMPGTRVLREASGASRVAKVPAAVELRDFVDPTTGIASEGRDLVLYLSNAPRLRARLDPLGAAPTALALGGTVLTTRPLAELIEPSRGSPPRAALVLPMGTDIAAYARAHRMKTVLASGVLPPLTRGAQRPVAPDWTIATACVVVPLLLSLAWLFFVRRFDRGHPEPWWLLLATFAAGGLSVVPAGFAEWALASLTPYLNPAIMTLGGRPSALPVALCVFTLVVGLSEEGSKLLGASVLAARRREFDEPVDGMIYGAASSLGFAAVENVKYFAFDRLSATVVLARTFTSIPAHLFFGAIWGYALGMRLVRARTKVPVFLAAAALAHGAFDTFLSLDGLGLAALVENVALASLFVLFLRRALRHGAVEHGPEEAPPSTDRALFAVGSPGLFLACAAGLHVFAFALLAIGIGQQVSHQKVTYAFLVGSTSLVATLGLCAWGLALTIPLDVAVDLRGITFAGRAVLWRDVRRATVQSWRERAVLRVDTDAGPMLLGPGPAGRIGELERAVRAGMESARSTSAT